MPYPSRLYPCTLPTAPVSRCFGLRSTHESISLTPTKSPGTNLSDGFGTTKVKYFFIILFYIYLKIYSKIYSEPILNIHNSISLIQYHDYKLPKDKISFCPQMKTFFFGFCLFFVKFIFLAFLSKCLIQNVLFRRFIDSLNHTFFWGAQTRKWVPKSSHSSRRELTPFLSPGRTAPSAVPLYFSKE